MGKSNQLAKEGNRPAWVMPWNADGGNESVRRSVELASMALPGRGHGEEDLREDLRRARSPGLGRRRAIVALSLIGMSSMALVSLFQTGLLRHLPDPPFRRFHSDRVNSSFTAYQYEVPHGPLSLAAHALNVVLAAIGGRTRAHRYPWIPLVAAGKAGAEAAVAAKYLFYQMPVVERSWCAYAIVDALAHLGTFALTLPEAVEAVHERCTSGSHGRRL